MARDRPRAWAWITASALAGALGGLLYPEPPGACFLSAGLAGFAQALLLRRVDWRSWALTAMIAGGAGFALARAFAGLDAYEIQSGEVAGLARLPSLSAAGGALIGACQSFLLSGQYRRAAAWLPARAIGATLPWTASARFIVATQPGAPQHRLLKGGLRIAAAMAVSWGGPAAGTALAMRKLELQPIR